MSTTDNPTRVSNGSYDGLGFPTSYSYDALNRVMQVQMQDGATSATSYSGNQVTATDAAGKKRQLVYDAAGRLKAVYEDPGGLLNYGTNYGYDALDNLSWVSQGNCPSCQGRAFHYYGTGWLKDASNGGDRTGTSFTT